MSNVEGKGLRRYDNCIQPTDGCIHLDSALGQLLAPIAAKLKMLYFECCKPGSKANDICDFEHSAATPCESKYEGEFLPEAR